MKLQIIIIKSRDKQFLMDKLTQMHDILKGNKDYIDSNIVLSRDNIENYWVEIVVDITSSKTRISVCSTCYGTTISVFKPELGRTLSKEIKSVYLNLNDDAKVETYYTEDDGAK